jgi:hypothetical protein
MYRPITTCLASNSGSKSNDDRGATAGEAGDNQEIDAAAQRMPGSTVEPSITGTTGSPLEDRCKT